MSYLDMNDEEIHDCVERSGLDDDMFFSLHEDAVKQIKELKVWEKFATYLLGQSKLQGGTAYEDHLAFFREIK